MSHMKQSILSTSIWARLPCSFLSRAKRQHCVGFFHKRVKLSSISGFSTGKPGNMPGVGGAYTALSSALTATLDIEMRSSCSLSFSWYFLQAK